MTKQRSNNGGHPILIELYPNKVVNQLASIKIRQYTTESSNCERLSYP